MSNLSNQLTKAILSMDVYNRGYDAGINVTGDSLGTINIQKTTLDGVEVFQDSAILVDPVTKARLDQPIGFYALAYEYQGDTIISYRGTDDLLLDQATGYGIGAGFVSSSTFPVLGARQGDMALQFYNEVASSSADTLSLTGHSLGGGLAGFVAANDNVQLREQAA